MSDKPQEGEASAYERIRSKKTLEEILAVATSFEESARDFYQDLIPKVSKSIRYLVEELAEEEQEHFDLFTALSARKDLAEHLRAKIAAPPTDRRFSDYVHLPDLGEAPDDQAVLQYAMGREHAAMEHYRALVDSTGPGPIHDLFEFLANEETKHKAELEKTYYEIIYSGGV
jgi:rubrerythrin